MLHRLCRRNFLSRCAFVIAAPSLLARTGSSAAQTIGIQGTSSQRTIYKSLKWNMIDVQGSILDMFRMLSELGFDGVELDSPGNVDPGEARAAALQTGVAMEGVVDSKHWEVRLTIPM